MTTLILMLATSSVTIIAGSPTYQCNHKNTMPSIGHAIPSATDPNKPSHESLRQPRHSHTVTAKAISPYRNRKGFRAFISPTAVPV